jgi:RNA polymerase-binding transcription factor DksA
MAAKKTSPKSVSPKGKAKPAVKPSKPAQKAKKPVVKAVKKAAPAKKPLPVKKAAPAKKRLPVKKAAPAKKAVPAKKAKPAKKVAAVKKAVPVKKSPPSKKSSPLKNSTTPKKSPPLKKAIATTPAKKPVPAVKPESKAKPAAKVQKPAAKAAPAEAKTKKPAKVETPAPAKVVEAPAPKVAAPAKIPAPKPAATKPKSSLVDFPVPPAPVRPPFVPPKASPSVGTEPVAAGSNGSHSPAFVQKQRQRLLDLRDDLVDAMSGMTRDTIRNAPEGSEASGSGQHQGDAGSDAYDRDFALSVLAKEQDALYEIEQALQRIKKGSYGICEMSSRKIPQARLEAIPFARLTVECQAQWEKEYGKRRFRPSNEVGFSGGNYIEDEDSETVSLDEDED